MKVGYFALLSTVASVAIAAPAIAQTGKGGTGGATGSGLEEIVVTANKREQNLQKAPVAITAITAAQAELRGVTEVKDISALAPNVTVLQGTTNATAAAVTIRGIVTPADESQGFDSAIGIYRDGVYIARSSAASSEVLDLERIEVLRGPQGTLFGRNTTGGAINFITRDPANDMHVKLRAGYGNYNLATVRASVDTGEFSNGMKMTLSGIYKRRNGTVDNLLQPDKSLDPGAYQTAGFRWATVLQQPGSAVKITNIFDYTWTKGVNTASQLAAVGDGVPRGTVNVGGGTFNLVTPANIAGFLAGTSIIEPGCPKTPSTTRLAALCEQGALPYVDIVYGDLFRIEADLGAVKLRSSTAMRHWQNRQDGTDLDGLGSIQGNYLTSTTTLNGMPAALLSFIPTLTPQQVAYLSSQPVPSGPVSLFQTDNYRKQTQFSQELELLSNRGENFEWVAGAFFFHENGYEKNPQYFVIDTNAFVFNTANFGPLGPMFAAANPARFRQTTSTLGYYADATSYAVYGQGTYRPGGKDGALGVTLGLRYSWDKKHFARFQNGATAYTGADIALNDRRANFSAPTGNLTIDYRASPEVNLYGRIARGYRSGGFNARQPVVTAALPLAPFNNEMIWSYEVGMKTEVARRVRFNVAAFYNNYSNLQVAVPVPIQGTGSFGTIVANAGKVEYYGFEAEGQLRLNDIFSIDGNLGYTHQKYKEYMTLDDSPQHVPTNIASVISPAYSPKWTANIAGTARVPLGGEAHMTTRVGYDYYSDMVIFNNAITAPFQKQTNADGRGLLDAQVKFDGLQMGGLKNLALTFWGKNLTNKEYRVRSVDFGALGFAYTVYGEPRTFGATLDLEF